jgi:hypothetical protein
MLNIVMKMSDIITEETEKKIDTATQKMYKARGEKSAFTKWRRKPIDTSKPIKQRMKHAFHKGFHWGKDIASGTLGRTVSKITNFLDKDARKSTMR